jgi:hypothetical protein
MCTSCVFFRWHVHIKQRCALTRLEPDDVHKFSQSAHICQMCTWREIVCPPSTSSNEIRTRSLCLCPHMCTFFHGVHCLWCLDLVMNLVMSTNVHMVENCVHGRLLCAQHKIVPTEIRTRSLWCCPQMYTIISNVHHGPARLSSWVHINSLCAHYIRVCTGGFVPNGTIVHMMCTNFRSPQMCTPQISEFSAHLYTFVYKMSHCAQLN